MGLEFCDPLLDPPRRALYERLYQGLSRWEETIPCGSFPPGDVNRVLKDILLDHPELAQFEGKWAFRDGVCPQYVLTSEEVRQMQTAAKQAFSRLSKKDLPRSAYVWLLRHVAYDQTVPHSQNAYGTLVQRRAVCKGIAKTYQLMMRLGNIPCILVEGTLDGVTKHVWNMVYAENRWRHVDVTMGYPIFRPLVGAEDEFGGLLLTTEAISRSHGIRNVDNLPK